MNLSKHSQPASLCVLQRSEAPCKSNQCFFHVAGLPNIVFCAFAVDGTILVKQASSELQPLQPAAASSATCSTSSQHQAARAPAADAAPADQFQTVLLINEAQSHWDDPIQHLMWGGGPHHLLAAASKQDISIISVAPFMESLLAAQVQQEQDVAAQSMQQQLQQHATQHMPATIIAAQHNGPAAHRYEQHHQPGAVPTSGRLPVRSQDQQQQQQQQLVYHPSTAAVAVHSYQTMGCLLALQWTSDAGGLLLSDAGGNIVMLEVAEQQQKGPPQQSAVIHRQQRSSAADPTVQQPAVLQVRELWVAHADGAHSLIAAGASATHPCATVAAEHAQRVIVWWPSKSSKQPKPAAREEDSPVCNAAQGQAAYAAATAGGAVEYMVGAEVIRHPVAAVHLQWSPPLYNLQRTVSSSSGGGGGEPGPPGSPAAAGTSASAASDTAGGSDGGLPSPTKGTAATSGTASSSSRGLASDGQPALMTVGADGIIRIFVEVVMADIAPIAPATPANSSSSRNRTQAAATSGSPAAGKGFASPRRGDQTAQQQQQQQQSTSSPAVTMSQFCLTLVIEPPGLGPQGLGPLLKPGFTACWAKFLSPQDQVNMLWLVGSYIAPTMTGPVPLAAALSGMEAAVAVQAGLRYKDSSAAQAVQYEDHVYLWGVDGLASVTLSGIAQNAIMSSKLSQPKAWCWGKDTKQLTWQQPHLLLHHAAAAAAEGGLTAPYRASQPQHSLDVWVVDSAAGPLLSAMQQFHIPALSSSSSSSYSEGRCFQVTPLTGYNESGQPASAIAVGVKASRSTAGAAGDWVQLSVHQAADVAATVSKQGAVALWSLAPIMLLPWQPYEQQSQQQLPDSWQQCCSCCWVTYGGATAGAAAAAAGVPGLPLLLAVCGEQGIDVCWVQLFHHQQQQQQQQQQQEDRGVPQIDEFSSSHQVGSQGVFISGVQVLAQLGLPAGITLIKQLQELAAVRSAAADSGPAAQQQQQLVLQTVLLGLGSTVDGAAGQQQQQQQRGPVSRLSDGVSSAGGGGGAGHDVWVTWTLTLTIDLPTAAGLDAKSSWSLSVSLPNATPAADAVAAAVGFCDSISGVSSIEGVTSSGMSDQKLGCAISCLHCPSPASPFLITGNASGHIGLWQVAAAPGEDGSCKPAAPSQQASSVPMAGTRPGGDEVNQGSTSSSGNAGPAVELVQACSCDVGGVDLGGICVAVALCTGAGYAAAAITCGQTELEDVVFIWCAEGATHTSSSSGRRHTAQHGPAATGCSAAGGGSSSGVFVLDCLVPLEDTAASLSWCDTAGLPPLLAVGYASGLLELYTRDHSGQWNTLACYQAGVSVNFIAANKLGLPLLVTGSQLLMLSNLAAADTTAAAAGADRVWSYLGQARPSARSNSSQLHQLEPLHVPGGLAQGAMIAQPHLQLATHAVLGHAAGSSSLALYDPEVLGVLVGQGRLAAVASTLRHLMLFIRQVRGEAVPDGQAAAASAAALWRQQDEEAAGAAVGTPGPVIPLKALFSVEQDESSQVIQDAVACCCKFRDAVLATMLGHDTTAAAAATAGGTATEGPAASQTQQRPVKFEATPAGQQIPAGSPSTSSMAPVTPKAHPSGGIKPGPAAGSSALDTGMLDMSAFGGFDFGGGDDWESTPAPAAAGGELVQHEQAKQATNAGAVGETVLDTGLLDMTAFGGFGFGSTSGAEDTGWETTTATNNTAAAAAAAAAEPCHPAVGSSRSGRAASTEAGSSAGGALETGMLDMFAFQGFGYVGTGADDEWDSPSPPPPAPAVSAVSTENVAQQFPSSAVLTADGCSTQQQPQKVAGARVESQVSPGFDAAQVRRLDAHLLAKSTAVFPQPAAAIKPAPGARAVVSEARATAAVAAAAAREQLLSRGEVQELHRLLDIPVTRVNSSSTDSSGSGTSTAYYARLLGAAGAADAQKDGYRSSSDGGSNSYTNTHTNMSDAKQQQQQHGDVRVLSVLSLSPEQAQKLCHIAAALCTRTFMGEAGAAADEEEGPAPVGGVTSGVSGVASAAALAASWASGGADNDNAASSLNLSSRWSSQGLGRTGTFSHRDGSSSSSGTKSMSLAALAAADNAFRGALFQELDAAGKVFAVTAHLALLQLATAAAAASSGASAGAATAAIGARAERDQRFAAAVTRLFQPVSVSRSSTAAHGKGTALLAHYPAAPPPPPASAIAGSGSSAIGSRVTPPLSPGRLQQLQQGSGVGGPRGNMGGLGSRTNSTRGLAVTVRSSMSVASMLSFSSLKDPVCGAVAGDGAAAVKASSSSSWAAFVGLMPGLTPLHCLWAATSSNQQALLDVLLPLVPDHIEHQVALTAAANRGSAAGDSAVAGAQSQAASSPFNQSGQQQQQQLSWAKLRVLGAGFWLSHPGVLRCTCEALAKAQYASSKDPHAPALLYCALGKKSVLQGLFRSTGNKKVADFLARDFSSAEGQAAASKNAFHLLGQHRYHLAAAFFVLAGSGWDAVSVLAREAADPQLALIVARLLDSAPPTAPAAAGQPVPEASGIFTWQQQQEQPAAAATGRVTGGALQKRLVNEELLLLAEADSDPAAAALATWVSSSDGSSAVSVLLTRLTAGAAGLDIMGTGSTGVQGNRNTVAAPAAAPPAQQQHSQVSQRRQPGPAFLSQLPVYLHWLLACGIQQLAGNTVTGSLVPAIHKLALRVARSAEVAGMPWAAAQALAVADAVPDPCGPDQGLLGAVLGLMWRARVAAGVLALQLVTGNTGTAAAAWGCDVLHWEAVGADHLQLLQELGLQADPSAVAAALARHAAAMKPVVSLPATAPGSSWCTLPTAAALHSNEAANGLPSTQSSTMSASGCVGVAAPDAVLAICVSRTSSSMVCSPAASTTISRTASTALAVAATPAATAAAGGRPAAPTTAIDFKISALISSAKQQQQQQGQQILGLSWELARQEGDKLRAVASCVGPQYNCTVLQPQVVQQQQQQQPNSPRQGLSYAAGAVGGRARPLVFASRNAGIISSQLCAPAALKTHVAAAAAAAGSSRVPQQQQQPAVNGALPHHHTSDPVLAGPLQNPSSAAAGVVGGSGLSGFMSQMLDQLRWPPDPWVVGEFPNRRSHSFGSAGMGHVASAALAAHPSRPLYVSGSSTGRIYLWQFGEVMCKAAYVPITSTQLQSSPKRLALHEAVSTPHWGCPAALSFSRSGGRFGAVGDGGLVGLWRQDFISAVDGQGHAEWVGHCLSRAGTGITFLGDTGSQVLVSGVNDKGGAVVLVDTLAPPSSPAAAQLLSPRGATPTALTLVPGGTGGTGAGPGAVLVVGDDAGGMRGFDVRVLAESRPLWTAKPHQEGRAGGGPGDSGVTCVTCWDPVMVGGSSGIGYGAGSGGSGKCSVAPGWLGDLVVSGSKDGSIAIVNAHTGSTLQLLQLAHYGERRGLLERVVGSRAGSGVVDDFAGPLLRARPAGAVAAAVTDVAACGEGLLSIGADGAVRFHPLAHVLNEWAGCGYC